MATWDGSYPEPDGPNYYANSSVSQIPANIPAWDYYLPNHTNAYPQNPVNSYPIHRTMVFEQSTPAGPTYYNNTDGNVIPALVPNVATNADSYSNNGIPAVSNKIHKVGNSEANFKTTNNQLPCFYEDNKIAQQAYYNRNNFPTNSKYKDTNKTYDVSSIVENSNLHATAMEFVPNLNKKDRNTNSVNAYTNSKGRTNDNYQKPEVDQDQQVVDSNNVFVEDNKQNDRKFDNKKDAGRKWRDNQSNGQYYRDDRKEYGKPQNFKKYQNDRYSTNQSFNDKPRNNRSKKDDTESVTSETSAGVELETIDGRQDSFGNTEKGDAFVKTDNTQAVTPRSAKNSRPFSNNNRGDRYDRYNSRDPRESRDPRDFRENRDHRNSRDPRYSRDFRDTRDSRDFRDRKNNHTEHNGYNRNNYNRDKYERRDNRTAATENRSKDFTDWRQRPNNDTGSKVILLKRSNNKKYEPDDAASQRERLTEQLNRGNLECLVCCESIRQNDYVWSCNNCYHVLHLKCVQKWAKSSQDDTGWRCPACQNVTSNVPSDYLCFCGKTNNPEWNRRDIAHSCGEICGRPRSEVSCVHKCTLLCHPGACPPCSAMVVKYCGCKRTSRSQKCSAGPMLQCDEICDRVLNCGLHKCKRQCHHGECEPCDEIVKQECFCGKHSREKTCVLDLPLVYSCDNVCDRELDCKNHKCTDICHPGSCGPCVLKPETVTHCCCGQTVLTVKRESCLDPISTCDKTCSKQLKCGQPNNPHTCRANCHVGDCPDCELITKVRCRCGHMDKEIPCTELKTKADDARCEKKCTKKRSCAKHKCNQMCCIDIEHICPLSCSKTLSCGKHRCEQTCHKSRCQPCWRSSFDELYCECGAAVMYPPVPCGARRPACDKPCSREHPCDHEVMHNCHSDSTCPPCSVLTQKWCYGRHELRKAVPCYVNDVSCGLPCGKPISCKRHKCIQMCHPDPCEKPGQICTQPCTVPRETCGHNCAAPCHDGKCPDTPCKEMIKVTCQCGNRTTLRVCAENARDYQRIVSGVLASRMADVQLGHSVKLEEVFGQGARKQNQLKTLECNDDCKMIERNRRLALGLQIVNPDLSGKLMPRYSDFMRQWAKKDPAFCQVVHDKLTELVQLAKTSKQKSRSFSFEVMNRDKRQFVHESCDHFGCESHAYDQEPKRNVVATAVKDKCWLPSYSLIEMLQRENGQRKVPGPMNTSKLNSTDRSKDVLTLNFKKIVNPLPATPRAISPSRSPEPEIDYFNYKG
ncbi:protein shuttle craft [Copidosoma floridanum]|uniref:protein shuttle craft n=1 Tax=Copidosoma floridanum TaxID=29053 RepID=UPI0006C9E5E1|nr:protein shuttle craft [Copidosoma floridanum]XP_014214760.1 protein shuttle craft [Copidosoma floridanum]